MTEMENDQRTDPMARVFPKVHFNLSCGTIVTTLMSRSPSALFTSLEPLELFRSSTAFAFSRSTLSTRKSTSFSGSGSSYLRRVSRPNDFKYVTNFQLCRLSQSFKWYIVSAFLLCHVFVQHFSRFFKNLFNVNFSICLHPSFLHIIFICT